jgi:hypothetical protein
MSWWARRQQRRALGDGVWRATADRLARALRSYEQMAQGVPAGPAADELWAAFGDLSAAVTDGRAACALAHASAPSSGLDVPGGAHAHLHKRLSRLGAEIAAAAEGAAMVRAGEVTALRRVSSRATAVRAEAAELLTAAQAADGAPAGR